MFKTIESENNLKFLFDDPNYEDPSLNFNINIDYNDKIEKEKDKDDEQRYFKNKSKRKDIFKITKENSTDSSVHLNKKRGRQTNKFPNSKIHTKFSLDNLFSKIQTHYISFIIDFINDILDQLKFGKNLRFLHLEHNFKRDITKKSLESKKKNNLGDIIGNQINLTYSKYNKNHNSNILEQIRSNDIVNKLLNENYSTTFEKIYNKNIRIIDLKEYGMDKKIVLSEKVKTFNNLKILKENDKKYLKYISNAIIEYIKKIKAF